MPQIIVRDLSKQFNSKQVFKNLNFEINDGEFLSVLGPSGCGKTTLMRILIGLESADSGQILLDGLDITNTSPSRGECMPRSIVGDVCSFTSMS